MKWVFGFLWVLMWGLEMRISAEEPPREALVMGAGNYAGSTYKGKAVRDLSGVIDADLPLMKQKLESLGFQVRMVANPTRKEAEEEVDAFSARIKARPGVSLFYFSGHGGEYKGKNYLIPREASIGSAADLEDKALNVQRVLNGMEESGASVNLVFLDCCREDLGGNVGGAELAPLKARGSFVGFATWSGDFADPDAKGSPYTRFLLKHLGTPGVSVSDMYAGVIADFRDFSRRMFGEERRPGFYSELDAPFYFVPASLGVVGVGKMAPNEPLVSVEARKEPKVVELGTGDLGGVLENGAVGQVVAISLPGGVPLKMCYVPKGKFTMGSPAGSVYHSPSENQVSVTISRGFWLGQMEMTQEQWQAVMGTNPSQFKHPRNPVEMVSWKDAQACVARLNEKIKLPGRWRFQLPTEAQWEYACRAGTNSAFAFGDSLEKAQANFESDKAVAVGGYAPNAWGFYDMHGNVGEWCADWYANQLRGGTDPKGPTSGRRRVFRGGSWAVEMSWQRSTFRLLQGPDTGMFWNGLRLALSYSR
jgi:sulfatase modifying factor 1